MNAPTLVAALVAVFAVIGMLFYRAQARHFLDDQLHLCNYLINVLYSDKDRKIEAEALFGYVKVLPRTNDGRLVAAASVRLIKTAKEQFDNKQAMRDIVALLISINHQPE